jgi:hypothetical protein
MNDAATVDGTAEEVGRDLVPHEQHPSTLFRTDDPVEVVEKAAKVADALKTILKRQGLTTRIQGRDHVRVEGWTTLGSMLGVVPVVVWTRKTPDGKTWEARVEARTLDGRIVGAAEAQCSSDESRWRGRDDYALRSMAQTRATSKALRGPLGFIVTLAEYDATPAEEMPHDDAPRGRDPEPEPAEVLCDKEQYRAILAAFHEAGDPMPAFTAKLDELGAPEHDLPGARVTALPASKADELLTYLLDYAVPS